MKKVLVVSSSPRRDGNSDSLANEFARGAEDVGCVVEKIFLADYNINYCTGCGVCFSCKRCFQHDDMSFLLNKMVEADTIVLVTPVYFYNMSAQLKTFIDRCCPRYKEMTNKEFYYILTQGEMEEYLMDRAVTALRSFSVNCLCGTVEKGILRAVGVYTLGEIEKTKYLKQAYLMGQGCAERILTRIE
ncbi:flavodoxin family protein [bacterium]|nr:flavodoxin family protein [bacterium]